MLAAIGPALAALQAGGIERISVMPREGGGFDVVATQAPLLVSLDKFSEMVDCRGFSAANLKRMYNDGKIRRGIAQPNGGEWICNPPLLMRELLGLS